MKFLSLFLLPFVLFVADSSLSHAAGIDPDFESGIELGPEPTDQSSTGADTEPGFDLGAEPAAEPGLGLGTQPTITPSPESVPDTAPAPANEPAIATPGDSTYTSGIAPLDRILAVVNNDVITQSDLDLQTRTVVQQLRQRNAQIPPDDVLQKQVLERAIMKRLQLQMAARTGIRVDDDTLNRAIETIAKQNNLSIDQFREVLARDKFDFAAFREDIRDEIIISRLRQREIGNKITVTDQEVQNYLDNQKVQGASSGTDYQIAQILIALPEAPSPEQVQTAKAKAQKVLDDLHAGADFTQTAAAVSDGQQALEGGNLGWLSAAQLPTNFADVVPNMKSGDISELIRSPSGFHIVKLLDKRGDGASVIKQTQARHILIHTNELTSDQDAETRLAQLKQRIDGGEDFAALARSHSEDAASAINGGSLGWVSPGDLVPQFEAAMNALEPGKTSEPFQTQFGWHIVQVVERRDHDNTADLQKSKAREAIRQRKGDEALQAWLRMLRDEAYIEFKTEEE
ncbi:MAG: peptidylprolyl isomerase [Gammaproteobacteria bacterium]